VFKFSRLAAGYYLEDLHGRLAEMILAGDIGGTKTVLAVYEIESDGLKELAKQRYQCADYNTFDDIVDEFLRDHAELRAAIDSASLAVAGPVVKGRCTVTNLPWTVDIHHLRERFGFARALLLNDLEAIATSIPFLKQEDLEVLNPAQADPQGVIGVIAPGTGLGEAFLTNHGSGYRAHASEGGHSDLAPNSALEAELLDYLQNKLGHTSYERVVSGMGIANIYDFLLARGEPPEPDWLGRELAAAGDPAPVIEKYASGDDAVQICAQTMRIFVSLLGAEAGNLALKLLARGGIYLAGGIPPIILPLLRAGGFMRSYLDKGRMSSLVESMPVYVVLNPEPALLGAAWATLAIGEG
jgi:glucokinase